MIDEPQGEAEAPAEAPELTPEEQLFRNLVAMCDGFDFNVVANEASNLLAFAICNGSPTNDDAKRAVDAYCQHLIQFVALNMKGKPKGKTKKLIVPRLQ